MIQFRQTESVTLKAEYRLNGTLTDPDTYVIAIEDESGQVIVNNVAMSKDSTGKFSYEYTSAADATTGVYTAEAILTTGTNVQVPACHFEIVTDIPTIAQEGL